VLHESGQGGLPGLPVVWDGVAPGRFWLETH
jgi:hypothetical protein